MKLIVRKDNVKTDDMKISRRLIGDGTVPLKIEENRLTAEYLRLISSGRDNEAISDEIDDIYDQLIHVRTEMAKCLGFCSYIKMAYLLRGRCDYGEKELSAFRSQVYDVMKTLFRSWEIPNLLGAHSILLTMLEGCFTKYHRKVAISLISCTITNCLTLITDLTNGRVAAAACFHSIGHLSSFVIL